jgi:tetrahydromethanopterin S-methyltransferase subunit G
MKDPSQTIKNAADEHLLKLLRDDLTSVNKRLDKLEDRIEDVRDEVVSRIHALSV